MKKLFVIVLLCSAAISLTAQSKQSMGLNPFPKALQSTMASATPETLEETALPPSVDLSKFAPPVKSQGRIGSCSAWSTVYYARTILEGQERLWDPALPEHEFSPLFTYLQITGGQNLGTSITDHMQILQKQGGVTFAEFNNVDDLSRMPPESLMTRSDNPKVVSYKSLPRVDGHIDLTAVKKILADGIPVVGGFELFEDFDNYKGGVYRTLSGPSIGGHAMVIVGYDDAKGALHIINSWGTQWGEQGHLWLSYESAEAMTKTDYGFGVMYCQIDRPKSPDAPVDLSASRGEKTDGIILRWTPVNGADRTVILRANNESEEWKVVGFSTGDTWEDSPLPPGVSYVYTARSQKGEGALVSESGNSPVAVGFTQQPAALPGRITQLEVMVYKDSAILVWPPMDDCKGYNVYKYNPQDEQFHSLGYSGDTAFRDIHAFADGTFAIYFVTAVNAQGEGEAGNYAEALAQEPPVSQTETDKVIHLVKDDVALSPEKQKAFTGSYAKEEDWFDPAYVRKAFQEFALKERKAFAEWKQKDASEFKAFKEGRGKTK